MGNDNINEEESPLFEVILKIDYKRYTLPVLVHKSIEKEGTSNVSGAAFPGGSPAGKIIVYHLSVRQASKGREALSESTVDLIGKLLQWEYTICFVQRRDFHFQL